MRRRRSGFTLAEVVIVVVIIGILATIAFPMYGGLQARARSSAIRTDLKNLMTAQELHWAETGVYTGNLGDLRFSSSEGVVVTIVEVVGGEGWSATTTHPLSFPLTCAVFVGKAAALAPATNEGAMNCL
jgi:prepilin-type N-terminal cleavage/methylation domain-containing protein